MCDTVGQIISGRMDGVSLNNEGKEQAARTAAKLGRVAHVYTSPMLRAMQTGRAIADAAKAPTSVMEDFNEVDFGEWTGKSIAELDALDTWRQFNTRRSTTRIPGGELILEVQTRAVRGCEGIAANHPSEVVAAVSHADVIRATIMYYLGMSIDHYDRIQVDPASISTIEIEPWGATVTGLNLRP